MRSVTLKQSTWQAMYAVVLESVARAMEEGDTVHMIELLSKLTPVLREAGESEALAELEDEIREAANIHATEDVMARARFLVREVEGVMQK